MSRITQVFNKKGRKTLIAYITVGYPDIETTLQIVPLLEKGGADIVELGIPFSDPMADGATIQQASYRALQNGVTPRICLDIAKKLRRQCKLPILFMTYYNPLMAYGLQKFCEESNACGIDGLIVPDLSPDEGTELEDVTKTTGLDLVYLLAPNSTAARIKLVAGHSRGFVYLVSVAGVTGAGARLSVDLGNFVVKVKQTTKLPVCIGFGISTPEQAKPAAAMADGVIIGSRLLQLIERDKSLSTVQRFIREVRNGIDTPLP